MTLLPILLGFVAVACLGSALVIWLLNREASDD